MAVIQQFRTSVRGFNRQDVQGYIEQMAAAHRQELAELQKRLEASDLRVQELEEAVSDRAAMSEELAKARSDLDGANQAAGRLRGELTQAYSKLTVAKKETERLQEQVASLEPMAAGYQELQDRAASLELDAHQKAQVMMGEAKSESERLRTDARRWLSQVMVEYSALRCGLDRVLAQLQALSEAPEKLAALDETAQKLRDQGGLK